jgi:hypothetical protein
VHSALRLSPKDARKVKRLLRQPRLCLLCGVFPPAYVGIFVPDKPELWGSKIERNKECTSSRAA